MISLTLETVLASAEIQVIFWLIVANVGMGVLVSLLKGNFNFHHLGNFLHAMVLPYIFVYGVFKIEAANWQYGDLMAQIAYVFILLSLLGGVWEKLSHFGLPAPKWLVQERK